MTRRMAMGTLCVAMALGGAGCFGGGDDEDAGSESSAASGQSNVRTDTGASTTGAQTAPDSADTNADDAALGTSKGSVANSTLQLASLERTSPDVVTAKFSISVPESADENFQITDSLASKERGYENGQNEVSGATLTDETGAKRYYVLTDTDGECLCSTNIGRSGFIDNGSTVQLYAKFPAPPGSTKSVAFEVPTFQSIDDAAIANGR